MLKAAGRRLVAHAAPRRPAGAAAFVSASATAAATSNSASAAAAAADAHPAAAATSTSVLGLNAELRNRKEILPRVDAALGRAGPPAIEYILAAAVRGSDAVPLPKRFLGNPCGHAFVAYTLPSSPDCEGIEHIPLELRGKRICMNIVNPGHAQNPSEIHVVNFLELEDMLFGIGDTDGACGSEQGGVYNRGFTGLRIEEVADADILAMHHTFMSLAAQGNAGRLSFSITGGQMRGLAQHFLSIGNQVLGNCSVYSSAGLVSAGLIRRPSVFPGRVWAMLHENALRRWGEENVNVVHYREVPGCHKQSPLLACASGELASITGPVATWRYWRRERFAHVTVAAQEGEWEAEVVSHKPPPLPPLSMRGVRCCAPTCAI